MIRAAIVDVNGSDISNSIGALVIGLGIPMPPMWQGKPKILRSSSLSCLPISAGMNDCLMASSRGCKISATLGAVRIGSSTCYTALWSELCRRHEVDFLRSPTASQSRSSTSPLSSRHSFQQRIYSPQQP